MLVKCGTINIISGAIMKAPSSMSYVEWQISQSATFTESFLPIISKFRDQIKILKLKR